MRIMEIADAEEQIALFRLITDKVWASLDQQRQAEAARKKAQQTKASIRPRGKRGVSKNLTPPPPPPPAPPPKPQPTPTKSAAATPQTPNVNSNPTAVIRPTQPLPPTMPR